MASIFEDRELLRRRGRSELRKALDPGGSGQYIVAEDLERAIRDYLFLMSPLTQLIPIVDAEGHVHKVARRTAVNQAWFEGSTAEPTYSQSTYDQRSVTVKIARVSGKVTDFQQSASRSFTDALSDEIASAADAFVDVVEFASMYGCATDIASPDLTGDTYQYSGIYPWILEDASTVNIYDASASAAAGATVTLAMLDYLYALTKGKYRNFARDPYVWLMGQAMVDKVSGLQTRIQRQVPQIEFEGGMVMTTYKGIPILPSAFCAPASSTAAPTNLSAAAVAGGTLVDDTYYYRVASITLYGEQVAAAEVNATTSGTHNTVRLSWTADANAKLYAIYKGLATADNNLGLLDIVAAKTYTSGAVSANVASYDDDGSITSTVANIQPLDAGEESVWLVNLGVNYGASRVVLPPSKGEPVGGTAMERFVRFEEIPVATDEYAFRLKSYHALQMPDGRSSAILRRAKTA